VSYCFAERLTKVFTDLHFTVRVENDLTHDQLVRCMKNESELDHRQHNCFVCCILSHGAIGVIYGTDGKTVPIKDLTDHFKASNCRSLSRKPKMFFVQACQGTEKQTGYPRMCFHLQYLLFGFWQFRLVPFFCSFLQLWRIEKKEISTSNFSTESVV